MQLMLMLLQLTQLQLRSSGHLPTASLAGPCVACTAYTALPFALARLASLAC